MIRRFEHHFVTLTSVLIAVVAVAGDETPSRYVPSWGRVIDPSRDCRVTGDAEQDRLSIAVPGTPHVLSAELPELEMAAPRVVRGIRGDFTATVRVLGRLQPGRARTTNYDPFHGAGLLVWQDEGNYLRLERAVGQLQGRPSPYINYELREGGRLAVSHGIAVEDRPLYLKLERRGRTFSAWYRREGHPWVKLPTISASMGERVEVGVDAVNSAARPLVAEFEKLRIDDAQGSMARDEPADTGPKEPEKSTNEPSTTGP